MMLMIGLYLVAMGLQLVMFGGRREWRVRRWLAVGSMVVMGFAGAALVAAWPHVFSASLMIVGCYSILNSLRVVEARLEEEHLRRSTRRTTVILCSWQIGLLVSWWLWNQLAGPEIWRRDALLGLVFSQTIAAGLLLASTVRNLQKTRPPRVLNLLADHELPTLSICIPARNETDNLEACLQFLLSSDYPKLEILVLDDCSAEKRTPEIIRSFAHAGVRFVAGSEPPNHWLAKNWAYQQLVREASGKILLFCGVDARVNVPSLRQLVSLLKSKNKQMLSVMPLRAEKTSKLSLVQSMRYFWEIVPPRRLFNRPPVLSTCWLIERSSFDAVGGFEAVSRSVVPEAYLARELVKSDGYSFVRSSHAFGITSAKSVAEQRETAIRRRYPQLHRRPEWVLLLGLLELVFLFLPFGLVALGWWLGLGWVAWSLAALASICLSAVSALIAHASFPGNELPALVAFPFAILIDFALMNYSMLKYEFSTVDWKGRNICLPVMHTDSRLPSPEK